jgi:hypothetical protein
VAYGLTVPNINVMAAQMLIARTVFGVNIPQNIVAINTNSETTSLNVHSLAVEMAVNDASSGRPRRGMMGGGMQDLTGGISQ